ncbi:unannotated protein [freshwater metagenome]|uniref:Unannotated protein n=1 Tax=freshwater metagenome TaxID=449393 RepID=A0A6J6V951_9ZZZZ
MLFTQIFGDAPLSSHSTFTSLPEEQELSAVSRNTEVDLFTHTEIKPGISTGNTVATFEPDALLAPVEIFEPDELPEPFVIFAPTAITGTVVPTAVATFLFFGLTGFTVFTVLACTVVVVELVTEPSIQRSSCAARAALPAGLRHSETKLVFLVICVAADT